MSTESSMPPADSVLAELEKAVGKTMDFTIGKRGKPTAVRAKVLAVRVSKTAFGFDFSKEPASVTEAYQYRLEEVTSGKRFWSPAFTARKRPHAKADVG